MDERVVAITLRNVDSVVDVLVVHEKIELGVRAQQLVKAEGMVLE